MNKKKSIYFVAQAAIIAAVYAVLTIGQNFLIPGSASLAVQVRVSEALCALCILSPAAIPGVTIGCVLSNITTINVMPLDMVFGSLATLIAAVLMYRFRNIRVKNIPVLSLLMPVIFNALIIGAEITLFIPSDSGVTLTGFIIQALLIAAGELISVFIFGIPLMKAMEKVNIFKKYQT